MRGALGGGRQMMRAGMGGGMMMMTAEVGTTTPGDRRQVSRGRRDQGYGLCKLAPFCHLVSEPPPTFSLSFSFSNKLSINIKRGGGKREGA